MSALRHAPPRPRAARAPRYPQAIFVSTAVATLAAVGSALAQPPHHGGAAPRPYDDPPIDASPRAPVPSPFDGSRQ